MGVPSWDRSKQEILEVYGRIYLGFMDGTIQIKIDLRFVDGQVKTRNRSDSWTGQVKSRHT